MATALDTFAKYVRPEVPGCPEPLVLDALLRVCIDFCTRTELLSEIVALTLAAGVKTYTISASAGTYPAKIRNVLKSGLPLDKTTAAEYPLSTRRTESGSPEAFHAPTRNQLTFEPVPGQVEALEVDVVTRPDRAATSVPDVLFAEWATTIANGAKAELMLMTGLPWANADLGLLYKNRYDADVATAAAEAAAGNVAAAMRITSPSI